MATTKKKNVSALTEVMALVRALESRDQYTRDHTRRVTLYALMLAEELNFSRLQIRRLNLGTALHDIGKIGVPDSILKKAGPLTDAEFEQMKSHTSRGAEIIASVPNLRPLIPIVRHHHERWDGFGYPDGLAKDAISPLARVVALADAFDAMTSHRPYRSAMSADSAFAEIRSGAGRQFDPAYASAFLGLRRRIEEKLEQNGVRFGIVG